MVILQLNSVAGRSLTVPLAAFFAWAVTSFASQASQPLAVVRGTVEEAGAAQRIPTAVVTLTGAGFRDSRRTDTTGAFQFGAVPSGRYVLRASKPGYLGGGFGQRSFIDSDKPLTVTAGQTVVAPLRVWRTGVLTGRLIDDAGEPAVGILVHALGFQAGGRPTLLRTASSTSDDRGLFRIVVPPSSYLLMVPGSDAQPALQSGRTDNAGFPPVFYPGATRASAATILAVGSGETSTIGDLVLPSAKGVRISGRVIQRGVTEPVRLSLLSDDSIELPSGLSHVLQADLRDDSFAFDAVLPGHYILRAIAQRPLSGELLITRFGANSMTFSGPLQPGQRLPAASFGPMHWAELRVQVGNEDVNDCRLELQPAVVVSGSVQLKGAAERLTAAQLNASGLVLTSVMGDFPAPVIRFEANQHFRLQPVIPGRYMLQALFAIKGLSTEEVSLGGRPVRHGVLTLLESRDDLLVSVSDRALSSIHGRVADPRGQSVPFATVLVFPAAEDEREFVEIGIQGHAAGTDQNGEFMIGSLTSGNYLIVARENHDPAWRRADRLANLRRMATPTSVASGETKVLNLVIRN